jgi:capsule polysaccharide export protein KpsC/LpsZ
MPSNHLLYVKEHPAMRGMRSSSWYKRLSIKPGIILVDYKVDTFELIKKSSLVSTITGSAGFEAYVLNKPVLMFGRTFFSEMITRYDSIETLRETLYFLTSSYTHDSNNEKTKKIARIYNISFDFKMHDPFQFPEVLEEKNIKNFYHAIIKHTTRLKIGD